MIGRAYAVQSSKIDENVMTDINYETWESATLTLARSGSVAGLLDTLRQTIEQLRGLVLPTVSRDYADVLESRIQLIESQIEATIKGRASRVVGDKVITSNVDQLLVEKQARIDELELAIQRLELGKVERQDKLGQLEESVKWHGEMLAGKDQRIGELSLQLEEEIRKNGFLKDALMMIRRNIDGQRGRNDIDKIALRGVNLPNLSEQSAVSIHELSKMTLTKKDQKQMVIKTHILNAMKDLQEYLRNIKPISSQNLTISLRPLLQTLGITAIEQSQILYRRMRERLIALGNLYTTQTSNLKSQHPTLNFEFESAVRELLKEASALDKVSLVKDVVYVEKSAQSQEGEKLKQIFARMVMEMRDICERYPKMREELVGRGVWALMEQPVWKLGSLENVVSIVQYVPETVRVESTTRTSDRSKTELHLRAMLKAALAQLELARSGKQPSLDATLLQGMHRDVDGFQSLQQLFRLYQPTPQPLKQIDRIVQKIVERIVEVPKLIPVERIVEKIVEVPKITFVEKPVHIPVQVIKVVQIQVERIVEVEKIVQKIVEVPTVIEKVVEVVKEVVKTVEVEKIVEVEVVREVEVIVEKFVPQYITEWKEVEVIVEKLVPVETIVERTVEVPVVVQKLVPVVREIPQLVEVEKIVEKFVKIPEDREVRVVENHIQVRYEVVERIIEKLIPVVRVEEKLVEVEKIVEKVVKVVERIEVPKEVEVIREVIVEKITPVEVIKTVQIVVPIIQEVIKEVDRRVEVPIYVEKLVTEPVEVVRTIIQTIEKQRIKEVPVEVIKVITQKQIVQIQVPIHHVQRHPLPVNLIVQKIVQVPLIHERIKQVKVVIQKIIQKLVEVPKVVQVEKIVEKIVVVPRVIQKIVEVPQIIEKIVTRDVEVEKIVEVQRIVEVPVIQEKIVFVDRIVPQVIEHDRVVDRPVQKLVPVETIVDRIVQVEKVVQHVVPIINEQPRQLVVEKLVPVIQQVQKLVDVQVQKIITVQVRIPVDRVVQKIVPVENYVQKLVTVPQIRDNIQTLRDTEVKLVEVEKIVDRVFVEKEFVEVEKTVPVHVPQVVEVQLERTVNVPVQVAVEVLKEVPAFQEKVVEVQTQRAKIQEVEKVVEKVVRIPQIIQTERTIPVILKQQQTVQTRVDNIITIPLIQQEIKQVRVETEKPVPVNTIQNQVQIVDRIVERLHIQKQIQEIEKLVHLVETQLQVVDRDVERLVEVRSTVEKLVEIPTIVEKIVEKIILMPQIVEVTKYLTEVQTEELEGMSRRSRKIMTQNEVIDTFAYSLDKIWRSNKEIEPGLPQDVISLVQSRTNPKNLLRSSSSTLAASARPPSQLVQLMASRLVEIKNKYPGVDLGGSDGLCERYLSGQGKVWLEMERLVEQSNHQLQKVRGISERNSEMLQSLKISYDILNEKYLKSERTINDVRLFGERMNILELLALLGDNKGYSTERQSLTASYQKVNASPIMALQEQELLKKLQSQLSSKGEQLAAKEREVGSLKAQLSTVNLRYAEAIEQTKKQVRTYADQLRAANQELRIAKNRKEEQDREMERLRVETRGLQVEYNLFKKESIELKANLQRVQLDKSTTELKNNYEGQIRELRSQAEANTAQHLREVASLKANLDSVEIQRSNLAKEIESLRAQIKIFDDSRTESQRSMKTLSNKNTELTTENDNLKRQLEYVNKQLQNTKKPGQTDSAELITLRQQLRNLQLSRSTADRIVQDLNRQIDSLRATHTQQQNEFSSKITTLNQQIKQQKNEIHDRQKQILFVRAQNESLQKAKSINNTEVHTYQSQAQVYQQQNTLLMIELNRVKDQLKILQSDFERNSLEMSTLRKERDGLAQSLSASQLQQGQGHPGSPVHNLVTLMSSTVSSDLQVKEGKILAKGTEHLSEREKSERIMTSPVDILRVTQQAPQQRSYDVQTGTTMQSLIPLRLHQSQIGTIMRAIIDKFKDEISQRRIAVYQPSSILLLDYNPSNLQQLKVKLLNPIPASSYKDNPYCPPELLRGENPTDKSMAFSLGLMWDAMIHGECYFHSPDEILGKNNDYRVRNTNINSMLKNTLFDLISRDANKRIDLTEARKRLGLQALITAEERGTRKI